MGRFIAGPVIAYILGVRIVARRHFPLRHEVSLEQGELGGSKAAVVGAGWPVTSRSPTVQHPQRCNHRRHVRDHARILGEIEIVEQLTKSVAS
jgi:hypothetical protein